MQKKRKLFEIGEVISQSVNIKRFRTDVKMDEFEDNSSSSEESLIDLSHDIKFVDDTKEELKTEQIMIVTSQTHKISEEAKRKIQSGKCILINRLKYYTPEAWQDNMVTFNMLMSKNLIDEADKDTYSVDVEAAVFFTFDYDEELLLNLFLKKVPTTIFEDKLKRLDPTIFKKDDEYNFNKVNINQYGKVPFGSYHSKLILYEFDDRLRVIISSANLTMSSWETLSQVLWLQDFPKKTSTKLETQTNDFRQYLEEFMAKLIPDNVRKEVIFRKKINLDEYDFTDAQTYLVGSVNGYFRSDHLNSIKLFGTQRISHLIQHFCKRQMFTERSKIWYQASSISKINNKFLQQMFFDFTGCLVSEERIKDRFGFIFPTEAYCRTSHLGIKHCHCLHLKTTNWKQQGFPRTSFYKMEGKNEGLDRNISHSKMMVITKDESGIIDDDTLLYFGSHNMSIQAWGKEEKVGQRFTIANWELGVAFLPQLGSASLKLDIMKSLNVKFPPEKYKSGDIPYFADIDYNQTKIRDFTKKNTEII